MKNYCLYMVVFIMSWNVLFAEIKNGYGGQIDLARQSLKSLSRATKGNNSLTVFQKAKIKGKISLLLEFIAYYEFTEELLIQFRTVAPDLYNRIDSIKDKKGQAVDVFVRFVPEHEMFFGAHGTTNLAHHKDDKDVYLSEYGNGTVSVKIASVNQSLSLLAHEFGHVAYQVSNLAAYFEFYSKTYQNSTFYSRYLGHNTRDLSGRKAIEFENSFRKCYMLFLKARSINIESPIALLTTIRRSAVKQ